MNLDDVKQFLDQFETCVIATVNSMGQPQAATVGFSVDDELKILFATNQDTRKSANIAKNAKVAMTFGFEGVKTVQFEGHASLVSKEDLGERLEAHYEKLPNARRHALKAGEIYYLITPTWLRFTDYTQKPPIFETENFS